MAFYYPGAIKVPADSSAVEPDINVGFVLVDDFTLMPVAGFVESLRFAADLSFRSQQLYCRWHWLSEGKTPVRASCGMEISPQYSLTSAESYDYIAVAAGLLDTATKPSPQLIDFLKEANGKNIPLIGLCSGSFILAEAGLLDGKKCAVHFTVWEYFKKRYPRVNAIIEPSHIRDGNIITCPGGTAIDLASEIIARHCGSTRAKKGLDYLLVSPHLKESEVHDKHIFNARVENKLIENAIVIMEDNISTPCSIKMLADQLGSTERQLYRLFTSYLNMAPAGYWRKLRLDHTRSLLLNTTKRITDIAYEAGFSDTSHFTHWFKKSYGETPAQFRRRRCGAEF